MMEASAGFEPAVEVLQVGLNGLLRPKLVHPVFRIAGWSPVKFAQVHPTSRALPSRLPSSLDCQPPAPRVSEIGGSNPLGVANTT